ncbi:MAG: FG-GAP-like repeat-containing protein [Candidatus Omnitrophota bacterium]
MKTLKKLFVGGVLFIGVSLILGNVTADTIQTSNFQKIDRLSPTSAPTPVSIKKPQDEIQSDDEKKWREMQKLVASDGNGAEYFGQSVSMSGDWAVVGAQEYGNDEIESYCYATIFKYDGFKWVETQKLKVNDGNIEELYKFGCTVSMSGNRFIMGIKYDDDKGEDAGAAYIFRFDGTKWIQEQKLFASDAEPDNRFGSSVSISGDCTIVNVYRKIVDNYYTNITYIFRYDGSEWLEEQKLELNVGAKLSILGDRVIGIHRGHAYIFKYDGSEWMEEQELIASDGNLFHSAASISDDRVIIAGYLDEDGGVAYIFKYDGTKWIEEKKLIPGVDDYISNVSIFGDWAIISSTYAGYDWNGIAYIFKYDGTQWVQAQILSPAPRSKAFGCSVSIEGNRAIIGAHYDYDLVWDAGSAYIYELSPEGFSTAPVAGDSQVALGTSDGKVYLYDHNGNILPNWPKETNGKAIINSPSIADIDGDGEKEVIACTQEGVYVWNYDGTPATGWPYIEPIYSEGNVDFVDSIISGVVIADLDNDTKLEIIVSVYSEEGNIDRIKVFNSDGTIRLFNGSKYLFEEDGGYWGSFNTKHIFVEAVGDLEGDGDMEFLFSEKRITSYPNMMSELRMLHHDGNEDYNNGWPKDYWRDYDEHVTVKPCLGDLDLDGDLEIVIVEFSNTFHRIQAYHYDRYNESLVDGFPQDIPVATPDSIYYDCSSPVLGDLDNDGDLEIVVYSMSDSSNPDYYISNVLAYHHDGTLVNGFPIEIKNWKNVYYPPVIADIDGDDNAEVLVILHEYVENGPNKAGVMAYHSDGSIVDGFPKYVSSEELRLVNNSENSLAVGDLDEDGSLEIIALGYPDNLHIIPLEGTYNPSKLEWPQYRNNSRNTNCLTYTNKKPYFDPKISPVSEREMELIRFYIEAYDGDNDLIDITLENQPSGSYFRNKGFLTKKEPGYSKARFTWRPKYGQAGDYNLTFKATDSLGDSTIMQVYITVTVAPNAGNIRVSTLRPHNGSSNTFYQFNGVEAKINETGETALTKNGRYDFKDVPVGTYTVSVKVDGYVPRENNIQVTVVKGKSKTVVFKFKRSIEVGGYVEGYIKSKDTEKGIKGATLYASNADVIGTTDQNGYYNIKLPEGSYSIGVSKGGYHSKFIGTPAITKDKTYNLGDVYLKKAPPIGVDVGDPSEDGGKGDNKRPATQSSIRVTPLRTLTVKLVTSPISIATSAVTTAIKVSFQAVTSMFRIN